MTSRQHHDGYAWTWEPGVGALLGISILALLATQTGRSLALLLGGSGWHWPRTSELIASTGGILTGNLTAGLEAANASGSDTVVAVILAVVIFTTLLTTALIPTASWVATRRYPGMASAGQADQLLGIGRLRATRAVVRPDLYRKAPR